MVYFPARHAWWSEGSSVHRRAHHMNDYVYQFRYGCILDWFFFCAGSWYTRTCLMIIWPTVGFLNFFPTWSTHYTFQIMKVLGKFALLYHDLYSINLYTEMGFIENWLASVVDHGFMFPLRPASPFWGSPTSHLPPYAVSRPKGDSKWRHVMALVMQACIQIHIMVIGWVLANPKTGEIT